MWQANNIKIALSYGYIHIIVISPCGRTEHFRTHTYDEAAMGTSSGHNTLTLFGKWGVIWLACACRVGIEEFEWEGPMTRSHGRRY